MYLYGLKYKIAHVAGRGRHNLHELALVPWVGYGHYADRSSTPSRNGRLLDLDDVDDLLVDHDLPDL